MSKKVNLSKEDIEKYYIEELHTVQECANHFRIAKGTFNRYLKKYGIVRSKEDKSKVYSRAQSSEDVRRKAKETNIKKYGAVSKVAAGSPIRFIDENTFAVYGKEYSVGWLKEKYLTENVSSAEICHLLGTTYAVVNKINKHYHISKNFEQRYELIRQKTIDKYGVASTLQLDAVKKKSRETCLKKYGVDNPMKTEEIQVKCQQAAAEKRARISALGEEISRYYIDENHSLADTSAHFSITIDSLKNYLKEHGITKDGKKVVALAKDSFKRRYGVGSYSQRSIKNYSIWNSKEKMVDFLSSLDAKPSLKEISEYFNVDETALHNKYGNLLDQYIDLNPKRSRYEDDIKEFLVSLGVKDIIKNDRSVLSGKEIDLYIPEEKLGIEFNGDYWHSDIFKNDHNGRSTYQQEKSLAAEKKGVFIFTVFEREWNDILTRENIKDRLKSLLIKNSRKIPARKCSLCELDTLERSEFLNLNHIQGNCGASMSYGLKYHGELVACMCFSHPKSEKYTWELSRFCTKRGATVQGGASKLFKEFIKRNLSVSDTVSSYSDITKTKGDLYRILGFDLISVNSPNYVWINFATKDVRTRYQEQEAGEVERMHSLGYHRVCDCGTKTWVYTVK